MPIVKAGEYKVLDIADDSDKDLAETLDDEYEDFYDGEKICTLKELLGSEILVDGKPKSTLEYELRKLRENL